MKTSVVAAPGFHSTGYVVVAHRFSCGSHGMCDLSGPQIEPMSPVLAGRFFTTEPRKALLNVLIITSAETYHFT